MPDEKPFLIGQTFVKLSSLFEIHRDQIREIVLAHNAYHPRVFGSVLNGCDTEESDLDLLIEPTETTSLFDIGAIRYELKQLLQINVDVLTPNALPESFKARVLAEAQPV
jgi:predicted nucleotidyltransferase